MTELARELKMRHPNYLYRVLPQLEAQGAVRKDGKGWHAAPIELPGEVVRGDRRGPSSM